MPFQFHIVYVVSCKDCQEENDLQGGFLAFVGKTRLPEKNRSMQDYSKVATFLDNFYIPGIFSGPNASIEGDSW